MQVARPDRRNVLQELVQPVRVHAVEGRFGEQPRARVGTVVGEADRADDAGELGAQVVQGDADHPTKSTNESPTSFGPS